MNALQKISFYLCSLNAQLNIFAQLRAAKAEICSLQKSNASLNQLNNNLKIDKVQRELTSMTLEKEILRLEDENSALKEISTTDPWTSLLNRRGGEEKICAMIKEMAISNSYASMRKTDLNDNLVDKRMLALIMVDIDHFKFVNDTFGHPVGDKALAAVANIIKQVFNRHSDINIRFGGEEFVVVFECRNSEEAQESTEWLRLAIASQCSVNDGKHGIKVSIGLAIITPDHIHKYDATRTIEQIIQRADTALYKAKDDGRNQTCVAAAEERVSCAPFSTRKFQKTL